MLENPNSKKHFLRSSDNKRPSFEYSNELFHLLWFKNSIFFELRIQFCKILLYLCGFLFRKAVENFFLNEIIKTKCLFKIIQTRLKMKLALGIYYANSLYLQALSGFAFWYGG
jgi:hypothetical protein